MPKPKTANAANTTARKRKGSSLHRRVRRNGKQWVCEYEPGFYKHCLILIDGMKPGDKWASSGRATVSPNVGTEGADASQPPAAASQAK